MAKKVKIESIKRKVDKLFINKQLGTVKKSRFQKIVNKLKSAINYTWISTAKTIILLIILGAFGFFLLSNSMSFFNIVLKHKVKSFSILRGSTISTHNPIYSTPSLVDINGDGRLDANVANTAGDIYAVDVESGKVIYHFNVGSEIIASPIFFDVNDDNIPESFWITTKGTFYLLNSEGNYLYTSKKNSLEQDERVVAKPAIQTNDKNFSGIYIATERGNVYCLEKKYGLTIWKYKLSYFPTESESNAIFASPMLVAANEDKIADVIVASTDGRVFCLNGKNGSLIWQVNLKELLGHPFHVKASMTLGNFISDSKKSIAICSTAGAIVILSPQGKLIRKYQLNLNPADNNSKPVSVVASLVSANLSFKAHDEIVITTLQGNIYLYHPDSNKIIKQCNVLQSTGFRSSPVLFDLNIDKYYDIIIGDTEGKIFFIDGKDFKTMMNPYPLDFSLTASPLVSDINFNGIIDFVFAGENGDLTFIHLEPNKKKTFNQDAYKYTKTQFTHHFLINDSNHSHLKK